MIPLKPGMSLPELQEYIADMKKRRGFQVNLEKEFILLVEEVGELAKELKQVWRAEQKG